MNKKILFVFLFAFFIRLIALNQSLWLDEAITAKVVMTYKFSEIISKFSPADFHPPFYYFFIKGWTNIFGYSEIALRMPSVLFSLMTGWIVYLIGGMWPALFFLFNPLIVYYSQEARMYMMVTFFLTTALYYFFQNQKLNIKNQNNISKFKNILLMNLFFTLAFFSFYGSIFLIITVFLYLFYKKQFKYCFISLLVLFLNLAIISPLLYQQFINSKIALTSVVNWSATLGKANIKNLLLILLKFSIGRISFYPKWFYYLIAGGWSVFVLSKIFIKKTIFIYLFIFPLFLGFIISFFMPMLQYFRFLYLIPIMSILLTISNLSSRQDRLKMTILSGFIIFSLIYLFIPQFHREDWKGLVKNLPNDKPIFMIASSSDPLKYYNKNFSINNLTSLSSSSNLSREIIVIPFSAGVYGLDYKSLLNKKGYQLKKEKSFREVTYEQWSLK